MIYVIKAHKNEKTYHIFCEDYSTSSKGLNVFFDDEWFFLPLIEVWRIDEIDASSESMKFNREYIEKIKESK